MAKLYCNKNAPFTPLKGCPFCGGKPRRWMYQDGSKGWYSYGCPKCEYKLAKWTYFTDEEAQNAWNTRFD